MSATGYNDTLNNAYMPVPPSITNYNGPTGGNWINWTVNAKTIQAIGATGATGTTMSLTVPTNGAFRATIGGTGAMLISNSVYMGQGAGWNNGSITGYTGSALGYGVTSGSIGIGVNAASYGQSSNSIAIGNSAGLFNQGPGSVAIGYYSAGYTGFTGGYTGGQGSNSIAIGYQAGYQNDSSSVIVAPYVQANSIYEYGSSYALPGTANNCVGSFSYNGQYTGFCINASATIYLSNNYGAAFSTYTFGNNIFGYNVSSTGQYQICTTNVATTYYSSNYGGSFATITLPTLCSYGGYLGSRFISSNGQVICMFPLSGTTGVPLYSNNGGSIGTPSFSVFPATSGLYLTSAVYGQSSMDTTGQYIICPSQSNSIYALYYSNNGTAGVANVTFTNLVSYSATNGLPSTTYFGSASISGNAKYMLVGGSATPFTTYISSNANATPPSNITFSPIDELPSNISDYRSCDISNTGQYMAFLCTTSTTNACIFVSYNYGVNWSAINGVGTMNHLSMSLNGNFIMALPNVNSSTPANGVLLILSAIPSNTNNIAIGYNAGYLNQQGNTVAIGATAGYTNQPVNSVAIGNGAGYTQDLYTYRTTAQQLISAGAVWTVSMSYTGQNIFFGQYTTYGGSQISQNFGESFISLNTVVPFLTSNTLAGSVMSWNGQYMVYLQYNVTSMYYSANANASPLLITTTQITGITGNSPYVNFYGINCLMMSSTGQYIIYGNQSTSVAANNYVYYCSNGGPLSNPSTIVFTNLTTTYPSCGLPAAQTTSGNGLWYLSGMSANGQYLIMPYLSTATGTQSLYYSSNGTAGASSVTFNTLSPVVCGIPVIAVNATTSVFLRAVSMSGTGQYILVNIYGGNIYLSSNGTAGASNITFTCISGLLVGGVTNGLPTTVQNWGYCGISNTGQYMFATVYNTSLYVSTNYGVNWVYLTIPTTIVGGCAISPDGSKIIVCQNGGTANTNYAYTLQQNTSANTIAIGYNAGYYNQPSGSFFVSTSSVRSQAFSQTVSGGVVYSIASGEIYYSTAKSFVIDHPLDENRYLVHSCLEGPEVGVYYRGTAEIINGRSVTVTLPPYVDRFAYDFTIKVTAVQEKAGPPPKVSASLIRDNRFTIYSTSNGMFHWHVYGKRGELEAEPLRDTVQLRGDGPYTYLVRQPPPTD